MYKYTVTVILIWNMLPGPWASVRNRLVDSWWRIFLMKRRKTSFCLWICNNTEETGWEYRRPVADVNTRNKGTTFTNSRYNLRVHRHHRHTHRHAVMRTGRRRKGELRGVRSEPKDDKRTTQTVNFFINMLVILLSKKYYVLLKTL